MKELMIEAVPDNLYGVTDFVADELETAGCPMKLQMQITVAVEEIFINIARYAYSPEIGPVTVRVSAGDEIIIEFEDKGKPYNPLKNEDPNISAPVEEREIGGLGIFMVKNIMDATEYRYENNRNILRIKKHYGTKDSSI